MIGLFADFTPRFVKRYGEMGRLVSEAAEHYAGEVKRREFPGPEHCFGTGPRD